MSTARQIVAANINALVTQFWPNSTNKAGDLSKFLGCSVSQAQRLLAGRQEFKLDTLEHVAERFDLPVWQLVAPELGRPQGFRLPNINAGRKSAA